MSDGTVPCAGCGAPLGPGLLACPACQRLVHADTLKQLADRAERAGSSGELSSAMEAWRQVLELLPAQSRQAAAVTARLQDLRRRIDAGEGSPDSGVGELGAAQLGAQRGGASGHEAGDGGRRESGSGWGRGGTLGVIGAAAWKFKALLLMAMGKVKFLLMGLGKAQTLISMLLFFSVYWSIWGWRFALGIVISIYIHEMGHVAALARYGIKATAPMFIPGLGAVIRLKQYPTDPIEDARVGLAGPIWGGFAALGFLGLAQAGAGTVCLAVAKLGAWINLFNMIPFWQLDGGRGFRALTRASRWAVVVVVGLAWMWSGEGLLALVGIVAAMRALASDAPASGGYRAYIEYALLIVGLTAMATLSVPLPGDR